MDYEKILTDIASELVQNKEQLKVRQMPSLDENSVVLYVYAAKDDLSKLIGVKGSMANSMRKILSVAGHLTKKKIEIKFESYE